MRPDDPRIHKGTKPNIDSYSAFFDNCKAHDTGLAALLEAHGVTDVYCCGLVYDICVKSSALHGAEMGFNVTVIEDACPQHGQRGRLGEATAGHHGLLRLPSKA